MSGFHCAEVTSFTSYLENFAEVWTDRRDTIRIARRTNIVGFEARFYKRKTQLKPKAWNGRVLD